MTREAVLTDHDEAQNRSIPGVVSAKRRARRGVDVTPSPAISKQLFAPSLGPLESRRTPTREPEKRARHDSPTDVRSTSFASEMQVHGA
jgi:hypothetical protein